MERFSLLIAAPTKLKGLGKEIENTKKMQDRDIFIQVMECHDLNTLNNLINQEVKPDFLLLFENITENRSNKEKAHTELLDCLRKIKFSSPTKIVLILQAEQENDLLPFVNELIKLDIQDFHFVSDFHTDDVLRWLLLDKKDLNDNQKYITTEITVKGEKEIVIKEIPKYIEVPHAEDKQKKKFSFGFFGKEKRVKIVEAGTKVIGITGTSRGAGVTSLCVELAMYYCKFGKTLVVERSGASELSHYHFDKIDVKNAPLHSVNLPAFQYVLVDFGIDFTLEMKEGLTRIASTKDKIDQKVFETALEKKFCSHIVCVTPASPWKLYEADFYINNDAQKSETRDWIFLFHGNYKNREFDEFLMHSEKRDMVFSFDNEIFIEELAEMLD